MYGIAVHGQYTKLSRQHGVSQVAACSLSVLSVCAVLKISCTYSQTSLHVMSLDTVLSIIV